VRVLGEAATSEGLEASQFSVTNMDEVVVAITAIGG
jgi:hypothetical protein